MAHDHKIKRMKEHNQLFLEEGMLNSKNGTKTQKYITKF